jgi:metal-sulfur cluster biosynthetic enzyme
MSELDERIEETLHRVYDPCSLAAQNPISLVDMGLVREWTLDEAGHLDVRMCVTSACCTMSPHFVRASEAELAKLEGVTSVTVRVDAAVFWTPDLMSERGKEKLEERRRATIERTGVRPMMWKERMHAAHAR